MRRLAAISLLFIAPLAHAQGTYWRFDGNLQNTSGQSIGGAKAYLYDQTTGGLATLFANSLGTALPVNCGTLSGVGNQIKNPLTTNGYGEICAYLPAGCYTVTYVSATTGTRTYQDQGPGCQGAGTYLPITGGTLLGSLTDSFGFIGPLTGDVIGNVTGALTGHASLDLPITGGTLTGNLGAPIVNAIVYACNPLYTGADGGAKINSALTSSLGLNGGPGLVIAGPACGTAWTTTVTTGNSQGVELLPALYTSTATTGVNLAGNNSALFCAIPSSSIGACNLQALAGVTSLVTISGGESVVHDVNLDGNGIATTVLNITGGGGRALVERVEVINSAGAGISLNAQNVYLNDLEVFSNAHQGLLCTNNADEWIMGGSQFEANGWSGIELNGCGSVRMVQGDISGNGQAGSAGTTGCSLYIHGTVAHIANSNIFDEVQSGNNFHQDICDIGWDAIGGNRATYSNSFVGWQSLGTAGSDEEILVQDGSVDNFEGGTLLLGNNAYGMKFSETAASRAVPSTVHTTWVAGYTGANAWLDTTVNLNDFTGSIVGSTLNFFLGPWITCTPYLNSPLCTENVTNTTDSFNVWNIIAPALTTGHGVAEQIGRVRSSTNDSAAFGFNNAGGPGSVSNLAFMSVYGAAGITVDGAGNASATSLTATALASGCVQSSGGLLISTGSACGSGGGGGTAAWGSITGTLSAQTDLGTALTGKVPTTTTVNGHALSSNVVVSATDLTTGTLPHARLPALVSGDIPNNAANTTGTAGGLTGNPSVSVTNVTILGTCTGCGNSPANITITTGTTSIPATTCTTATATTMTGLLTTSSLGVPTPTSDTSAVTGWGAAGGLGFVYWPTADTYHWRVCNNTSAAIVPGASITWNVGAK